ncbi:unnamed protein product [Paramecium pentaurelia]|uniref:Transmembrane protein n=1 Tax=Paramecium pentaurelia TaxID=43138 RepID=A0A8S1SZP8_9CILI|nr:unnamed protein product [Paramecium pentaurelia]
MIKLVNCFGIDILCFANSYCGVLLKQNQKLKKACNLGLIISAFSFQKQKLLIVRNKPLILTVSIILMQGFKVCRFIFIFFQQSMVN